MASSSSMATSLFLLFITSVSFLQSSSASPLLSPSFLYALRSQCSPAISPNPPLQVDGNFIEGVLSGRKGLYSKYGIRSLPAIVLVNQTSRVRYRGPNNLNSLVEFYEINTGFEASDNIVVGQLSSLLSDEHSTMKSLMGLSLKEISNREPYLLFLCLRIILFVFPEIMLHLRAFWDSYVPHLNLQIFGETSQVMGRVLNVIDVRWIWTTECSGLGFVSGFCFSWRVIIS